MKPEAIGELTDVSEPRLAPDGASVAFVVSTVDLDDNAYRSRIWVAAVDGSTPPRAFSAGEKRDGRPRWSPDGRLLAFVSHRDDEGSELYVLPVREGGEVVRLAAWPEEIEDVAWSPDGTRLAFTARQRDEQRYTSKEAKDRPPRRVTRLFSRVDGTGWTVDRPKHLFVVAADGSTKPRPITSGPFDDEGLSWSPDGRRVAFVASRHDRWDLDLTSDIFTVDVDLASDPDRLTAMGEGWGAPSWSPDGGAIAAYWHNPAINPTHPQVAVVPLDGGPPTFLTRALDRSCAPYPTAREPVWSGADVLFTVEDAGNVHLYRVAPDGDDKPRLVLGGDRVIAGFDARGDVLAFVATDPGTPSDLFVLVDGEERRITTIGARFPERHDISTPQRFVATSADGSEVEAWIMRPAGFAAGGRYPMLLNIHGGPFTQYGNRFFDEFQVQAGAGYAVLYANPRGSSGYSEAWGRAIRGPKAADAAGSGWGGVDYEDLMAVVDEAVRRFDFVDGERVGVLGGSYGGYMTSWIVGHTDRFRAACSERAVNDVLALEHGSDMAGVFRTYLGVSHVEDPDEYRRWSPIEHVDAMRTPLLIMHSENDLRCPIAQADQLFVALRMLEREVEMVRFEGEGHELSRSGAPKHRVQRLQVLIEFFDRYLS
jgi:dipeptidyl aminopeptidase/acylaminoacyl peptidase